MHIRMTTMDWVIISVVLAFVLGLVWGLARPFDPCEVVRDCESYSTSQTVVIVNGFPHFIPQQTCVWWGEPHVADPEA